MYKRILLAYDGSVKGRAALREGALIAKRFGAQVFLLSVIAEAPGTRVADGAGGSAVTQQHEDFKAVLKDGVARLKELGFEPLAKLVIGEPATEIGAFAEQIGADLVVVGHHRQSALGRWWSGPSGAYLIDHIHCSLLVSRNVVSDEAFAAELAAGGESARRLEDRGGARSERGGSVERDAAVAGGAYGERGRAGDYSGHQEDSDSAVGVAEESRTTVAGTAASAPGMHGTAERTDRAAKSPSPAQATRPPARRRRMRLVLFLLLPIALIVGAYWYITGGQTVSITDAYIEADKVGISTDVAGIVQQVAVTENQYVQPGQLLYRLDDQPYRIALERAEAGVGLARDSLNALKSNYADTQAQLQQAHYDVDYYLTEFHRVEDLQKAHVASQSAFDTARRNLQTARQKLASLGEQLGAIGANLHGDISTPIEENPRYRDAIAQRDEAARELAHTVVKAPFAGVVTSVPSIEPGRYLQVSMTAFYLVATDHVWVQANPKETEVTYVRPGQPATVKVDAYPDAEWSGSVESISPAAAQEFSLLPPQNTSGNWVKVVQRIPMRVRVDTTNRNLPRLSAGMSVEVAVSTGHRRGLPHLFGHARSYR